VTFAQQASGALSSAAPRRILVPGLGGIGRANDLAAGQSIGVSAVTIGAPDGETFQGLGLACRSRSGAS
jgi:hypothetical protein